MLFNLQGAHRSQRRAFILPQLFSFVKHFFKFFQTFSCSHSQVLAVLSAALVDSLIMLPHSFSLVKHFFSSFSNFFVLVLGKTRWWAPSFWTAHRGYHFRNLLSSSFFKRQTSLIPSWNPQPLLPQGFQSPCRKRSLIIAKSPALVNTFFQFFWFFSTFFVSRPVFSRKIHHRRTFGRGIFSCGSTLLVIPLRYPHLHIRRGEPSAH